MPRHVVITPIVLGISLLILLAMQRSRLVQAASATPSPVSVGDLIFDTDTPGAKVYLNHVRVPSGQTISLPTGVYRLAVTASGYETYTQTVEITAGYITHVRGGLTDTIAPDVQVSVTPSVAYTGQSVQVWLRVQDTGSGVNSVRVALDEMYLLDRQFDADARHNFEYVLPVAGITPGLHRVKVQVGDVFGNSATATTWFEVQQKPLDIYSIQLPDKG